jgi:hypothetical protein
MTDGQLASLSVLVLGSHLESMARFLFPVCQLRVSWCGAPSLMRRWVCNLLIQLFLGLAREVTLRSKSHRTHDHTSLSHMTLPPPWKPRSPYLQGGLVIPPGTGFPFYHLSQLAGLWWGYSNPPPQRLNSDKSQSHITTDSQSVSQSVSMSRCRASSGSRDQMCVTVWQ